MYRLESSPPVLFEPETILMAYPGGDGVNGESCIILVTSETVDDSNVCMIATFDSEGARNGSLERLSALLNPTVV